MRALPLRLRAGSATRSLLAAALCLAALSLSSCFHVGRGVKSCRYHFQDLSFMGMDASASHWKLRLGVANPNPREVTLTRMRFSLLHEADTLLSGWNPEERVLPAGDSQSVETTLDLPNAVFQRLPPLIWTQSDARFRIVADAYVHTWMGDLMVPQAIDQIVHVDMTKQAARLRDLLMQKLFSWPQRLREGGIPRPDSNEPAAPVPPPGDEPL
jgi:hypothetical protein